MSWTAPRIYRFTVAWGAERTNRRSGRVPVVQTSDKRPEDAEILALLPKYTGVIMQKPPTFSAIKIGGERAYDLAREGEAVDIPEREGRNRAFRTRRAGRMPIHAVFEVECGKGTYVRSLRSRHGQGDLGCYGPHRPICAGRKSIPFTADDLITSWPNSKRTRGSLPRSQRLKAKRDAKTGPGLLDRALEALDALLPRYVRGAENSCRLKLKPERRRGSGVCDKRQMRSSFGAAMPHRKPTRPAPWRVGKLVAIGAIEAGSVPPPPAFLRISCFKKIPR